MSHKIGKTGFKAGERITSASTLMKQYYNEQDWPFEKALSALQDVPAEVMTLLKRGGKTAKHGKFLVSSTELIQSDKKQVVWTAEELDRARIILNKMYDTEQAELDVLMFDCKKFLDGVQEQMDENTRIRLVLGEETAAARAEQLESTKTKKEAETNLEGLKEEYEAHQALCGSTLAAKRAELTMAELDYNVALKIENSSTCTDEQIDAAIAMDEEAPPSLLQGDNATALITNKNQMITRCTMGGGDDDDDDDASNAFFLFGGMHDHPTFHTKAAKFAMQRMAKVALQRRLGKHAYEEKQRRLGPRFSLLEETTPPTTTTASDPMAEMGKEEAAPAEAAEELAPGYKCNVNAVPNCPLLNDAIAVMVSELRDAFIAIKTDFEATKAHCDALSADYESQIKDWQSTHDRAEVTLTQAITTIDTNQAEGAAKAKEYTELETQWNMKNDECETKKRAILDTMCGIKVVRLEIFKLAEQQQLFQDCDVGDWVPQECSVSCAGGTQYLTREVLAEPKGGAECPALQMEQACNDFPCPINCQTDDWSGWSSCSKDCGGGVMARSRNIEIEPEFGGEECPPTSDAQMCNVGSCDVDCTIDDWSEWSPCSKACDGGIQVRRRAELTPLQGAGYCSDPDCFEKTEQCADIRFEQKPCNDMKCDNNVACNSKIDLLLLLDGSGSVRPKGFKKEKKFAEDLLSRMTISEEGAKAGYILFSKKIEIGAEMSFDEATMLADIDAEKFPARTTNTAEALSTALEVLAAGGRKDAQSIVFVITDGMPNDVEATAMMAEKVKQSARLVFVAVGSNLDMDQLYSWASFPPEMNVLTAPKFKKLKQYVGEFMADICPALKCDETLEGNGADYIGCQSVTVSGKQCQKWTEKFPQKHKFVNKAKKARKKLGDNAFCRNPDGSETIWCYTTDPNTRWEACAPRATEVYAPR